VRGLADKVLGMCSTMGQVAKLWPQLPNYSNENWADRVKTKGAQNVPKPAWLDLAVEDANIFLAECTLVPQAEPFTGVRPFVHKFPEIRALWGGNLSY
jgi:hypothetical protein